MHGVDTCLVREQHGWYFSCARPSAIVCDTKLKQDGLRICDTKLKQDGLRMMKGKLECFVCGACNSHLGVLGVMFIVVSSYTNDAALN
jgi:hypothetical protein